MDIDIDLYPNPTQDFLNLKINSDITHNISLVITDESGKLMTFIDHLTPKVIVPVSSYPSGIYVCNIQSKEAIFSTTFIV